jgi:hypothetical protein
MTDPTENLQADLDSHRQKIDVESIDLSIRELISMLKVGEIQRSPSYQRKFRWKAEDESRLIESLFLGIPVPNIFVATNADGSWELVDGLQRVSTVMHFVLDDSVVEDVPLLAEIGKTESLRLTELPKLNSFKDKRFTDLPKPLQLLFLKRQFRITSLSDKSDFSARFDLFERLNRGGISLSPQEVRDCVYRGDLIDLLGELAATDDFRKILKLQDVHQGDGTYEEQVLKYFAYTEDRARFDRSVLEFLNNYCQDKVKLGKRKTKMRADFLRTVQQLARVCDGPILKKNFHVTPLNQFEAIMVAAGELTREGTPIQPEKGWLNDDELTKFSRGGTNTKKMIQERIARAKALLSGVRPSNGTKNSTR